MVTYKVAEDSDRPQIVDFINMVFSQAHVPHDFAQLIPKVYGHDKGFADIHVIAKDEETNSIRGCVACYEFPMNLNGNVLKVGYIGSVSAHKYDKGMGHMKALVPMAVERAKKRGCDLLILGGRRQRYEYFGFAPVGAEVNYSIDEPNIRHALGNIDESSIEIVPMTGDYLDRCYLLYSSQMVTGARTKENFIDTLKTFWNKPYVILDNGKFMGYAAISTSTVTELVLKDYSITKAVTKAIFNLTGKKNVQFICGTHESALQKEIASFAEGYSLNGCAQVNVFNWVKVLNAFINFKNALKPLSDGSETIKINDAGTYKITIKNGNITVDETKETPDTVLNHLDATQYVFSFNPYYASERKNPWFPLPLYLPIADHF